MSYFIKQIGTKDCAIACLKMLLAITYRSKKFLYYPQPSKDQALSLNDVIKFAEKEGVELKGYKYHKKESLFIISNDPKLVVIANNNILHMVLLKKIRQHKVLIYDPKNGVYRLSKKEFINLWNGEMLEVASVKGSNYEGKYRSPIKLKYRIASSFLQICSMSFILLAMFFVNNQFPFYVPVSFFTCFAITELLYKKILILTMKRFDASIIDKMFYGDTKSFKDKYIEMTKFKTLVIGTPIQIINSLIVLAAGGVILSVNGYLNIINLLGVISIRLLFDIIEIKLFSLKNTNVLMSENELLESSDETNFASRFLAVQDKAYKQVTFINFKKYIVAFVTGVVCLLYAGFLGEISLNFIMFHSIIYFYLSENASKLLEIYLKNSDYRQSKCLYRYYCNEI